MTIVDIATKPMHQWFMFNAEVGQWVMRVPGGLIYRSPEGMVFVPCDLQATDAN